MTDQQNEISPIIKICICIGIILIAILMTQVNDTIQTNNMICDSYWNSTPKYKSEWISNDQFGNYKCRNGLYEYEVHYE